MNIDSSFHGSIGNPHPQYENIVFETKHPTLYDGGWNLIADNLYKYTADGTAPIKTSLSFIMYSNELQSTNNSSFVYLSVSLQNTDMQVILNIKPLSGNDDDNVRCLVTEENGFYRLRIYTKNNGYGRNRIVPLTFDSIKWLSTIDYVWANKRMSFKDTVKDYFKVCGTVQDIPSIPSGNTIKNGYLRKRKDINVSTGEVDVKGVSIAALKSSNNAYINNFTGGIDNQTICVSYSDSPTQITITNTGNIRTKSSQNLVLANNTNTMFVFIGGFWFQL